MSALDQAFIKAYAKDGPPQSDDPVARATAPASATGGEATRSVPARILRSAPAVQAESIERMYHEGSLYRVDAPQASSPRRAAVPTPHFALPPRTSPKRNVRRSMLQLLGQASELATPMPVEPPQRQPGVVRELPRAQRQEHLERRRTGSRPASARQAEAAAARRPTRTLAQIAGELAPLPAPSQLPVQRPTDPPVRRAARSELAPEIVVDVPPADEPLPTATPQPKLPSQPLFAPSADPLPNVAPLNLAQQFGPQFEVHGYWESDLAATPGPLVITPEPADLQITEPAPLVELKLEALPDLDRLAPRPGDTPAAAAPAIPSFRVDPPHATSARPHARFQPTAEESPLAAELIDDQPQASVGDVAEDATEPAPSLLAPATPLPQTPATPELNFADQTSETEADASSGPIDIAAQPGAAASTECIPVWEVDRFQWPVTVERLVSDKEGYFAQASERLLAAVRDGLRTLAISGSRRGEGRTTLALALARAAAKAGIQVAVIDADFARPQLAARIGLEIHHGWQDAATGLVPLSETAIRSLADNVTVLPLEASAARTGLALTDPRVTATLRAAAATFELVIVDLGPLAASDELLFPADEACPLDAAIIVRDLRYASAAESENIGQRLMAAGVEAVGIAENFVVLEEIPATSV
jgi:Mrp family chromosome partitioning ATPase